VNLYRYVANDPVSGFDPRGTNNLQKFLAACTGGVAAREKFCRWIPVPAVRAGCWAIVVASGAVCAGWCYWNY